MKKIFFPSLLVANFTYSQIVPQKISRNNEIIDTIAYSINGAKMSKHTKEIDKKFNFSKFTFTAKWQDLFPFFEIADENYLNKYNNIFFKDKDKIHFRYLKDVEFDSCNFDDAFLSLEKPINWSTSSYSSLVFCKSFNDLDSAKEFYFKLVSKYFITNTNKSYTMYFTEGEKLKFSVNLIHNSVYFFIEDYIKDYKNSMLFSYDYSNFYYQFFEIDNDYSFRGIKFGESLSSIKSKTKLSKYKYGDNYIYTPQEDNFLVWKGFQVERNECFFYFTKDFKLAEVSLAVNCFSDTDFDKIKTQLINKFGPFSYERNNQLYWVGKNLTIILPTNKEDLDYIHIYISSNKLKREVDKDY